MPAIQFRSHVDRLEAQVEGVDLRAGQRPADAIDHDPRGYLRAPRLYGAVAPRQLPAVAAKAGSHKPGPKCPRSVPVTGPLPVLTYSPVRLGRLSPAPKSLSDTLPYSDQSS